MIMCIQNLVSFCQFVLKTLSINQNLTSIKGRNPVANLQKTMVYITNVDLVNDDGYTKIDLILFIRAQDITKTRPCNIQQYFTAVKMFIFR